MQEKKPEEKEKSVRDTPPVKKPLINVIQHVVEPKVLQLIPKNLASKYALIPLYQNGEVLFVAMADPKDIHAIDAVRRSTKIHAIIPTYAPKQDVLAAIDRNYGLQEKMHDILRDVQKERMEEGVLPAGESEKQEKINAEQAPVIKLVNHLFMQAIQDRCSDIHIEPDERVLRVRCRKDGVLHENFVFQKDLESAIIARIKIAAGMDIAEKRKPQDGRIRFNLESKQIDVRVSSLPTLYGENIVMRLLDKSTVKIDLQGLGMKPSILSGFDQLIRSPHGILLVTGPTGSGKSTTLYAGLNTINDIEKNIVTVEDPIEYDLELIRQTQINPKVGLTFASGLRSILRQDPDVIMVGEIRDQETAEIAIQAALTGHLVLSTLHTNDACGAITRLQDMGIQPFLISTAIIGVLAQRLVRTICKDCKEVYKPPVELLQDLGIGDEQTVFYEGKGCKSCDQKKYIGRTAIHELLIISPEIRDMVTARKPQSEISAMALQQGMCTLREAGLEKARQGITTLQEVLKATL
ncbi:MAG: type II/IV secretion system protein [Candidatus Omnitrophica bacterium]|nr:type II/IV secretion system protein [Candidatus Omnitrophota bacterium]